MNEQAMTKDEFTSQLSEGAKALGVHLEGVAMDRLFVYYTELQRWNRKVNLVSRQQHDWVSIHFLDSLACLALGLLEEGCRVVDLGAGAGFPGVPLKVAREDIYLGMAEASGKKCAWLRHITRALELDGAEVLEGRFDELTGRKWAGAFDAAVSRAAAKPRKVVELARAFLAPGGRVLVYTTEALAEKGVGTVHPYTVPGSNVPSVIWEVEV